MATAKESHAMVTYFEKKYHEKYGQRPVLNRFSAKYGFDSILMQMSTDECKSLIDYYMTTVSARQHALDWFLYNYDKLILAKLEQDKDKALLAKLREESKKRVEEWKKKIGND